MWLAYLDDTGNTGRRLNDPQQPLHILGSLLLPEEQIEPLQTAIRDAARAQFPLDYRDADFEFHGADIFGGEGPFSDLEPAERIALYDELLALVAAYDCRVIVRGVNKPRLADRYPNPYHPHDIALMYTLEEIERFARAEGQRAGNVTRVLIVADENQEIEDAALRDLASYQELGTTWGWNPISIDHIVDTIHFVNSKTNWITQLADCVTYIAGRRLKIVRGIVPASPSASAVNDMWVRNIRPTLYVMKIWDP